MVIKGTDKIRGVLQLPTIKKELGKGKVVHITENDYHTQDVQIALRMGLVQLVDKGPPPTLNDDGQEVDRSVVCKSIYSRSISLPGMKQEIKPNQRFTLKESELNSGPIRAAISKSMIEVVSVSGDESVYSEGKLKVSDKMDDATDTDVEPAATPELSPAQRALIEAMEKNHNRTRKLDTNEEISSLKVIDSETPPAVTKKDIPDPRKQSVVFNPTGENPIQTNKNAVYTTGKKEQPIKTSKNKNSLLNAVVTDPESPSNQEENAPVATHADHDKKKMTSGVIDSPNPRPVNANQNDPKQNTVMVNPFSNPVVNPAKGSTVWLGEKAAQLKVASKAQDDLSFVDEEAKQKKRESHPILSQKEPEPDNSTELIDLDQETQKKISKHPVLGKKQNQNSEIDFIE